MGGSKSKADQIFISYRRADSAGAAGRIYDRLVQRFGKSAVFKDVDSIPLGVNFKKHLDSVVEQCSVVLVIIGDRWLEKDVEAGRRRIDDPRDFVRIEIESALRRGIPVIPLLIDNASVPSEQELPETLQELAYRNGMVVGHDPHFHTDVSRLIKNIETLFGGTSNAKEPEIEARAVRPSDAPAAARGREASGRGHSLPASPGAVEKKGGRAILLIIPVLLIILWLVAYGSGLGGGLSHLLLFAAAGSIVIGLLWKIAKWALRRG